MVQVHLRVRLIDPNKIGELKKRFEQEFLPVISQKQGFIQSGLLQDREALEYLEVIITFASEELRLQWARSTEHDSVWKRLWELVEKIEVHRYDVIIQSGS